MDIVLPCPHCDMMILLNENDINCAIYRHAVYRSTFLQIDPHTPLSDCDRLYRDGLIYGCGKPFIVLKINGIYSVSSCDYI